LVLWIAYRDKLMLLTATPLHWCAGVAAPTPAVAAGRLEFAQQLRHYLLT
jgi:hypothetical protein